MFKNIGFIAFLLSFISLPLAAETIDAATTTQGYGIWSLLPAGLAIAMALLTRQVIISLFLGIWAGAWVLAGKSINAAGDSFLRVMDTWLLKSIVPDDASTDHISIILFTLTVGGTIGIIRANGGIDGVISHAMSRVKTPKGAQFAAFLAGVKIFFDDYASMIISGNTARPLTDARGVSREKLAYIVDTTAAPLASTALLTTWIGFQVSLLDTAMQSIPTLNIPAYELMISSIPYSFYSILSILFILLLIFTGRDMGPMLKAERAARAKLQSAPKVQMAEHEAQAEEAENPPQGKAINAIIPLLALIVSVIGGLFITGWPAQGEEVTLTAIFGNADPFKSMLWASLISVTTALFISKLNSDMTINEIVHAMEKGFVPMLGAVTILTFAWAIAGVNDAVGTANYLVSQLEGNLSPAWLPAAIFVLAAIIAFATGTSWGVMAILVPLAIPLTWGSLEAAGIPQAQAMPILYAAVASVLTGAVWGDHCSPISDTTILSSVASGCDHIEHVRTQLPYAVLIATVSMGVGLIPVGYGLPWWIGLLAGIGLLAIILTKFGKKVE